jgi:streptogramin lyase
VLRLDDVGAWLASSSRGIVSHVHGPSGRTDSSVTVEGAKEHAFTVVQDGPGVLVTDTKTGVVSRIDPVGLAVTERRSFGAGAAVVAGAGQAYVIDEQVGRVSRIDPRTLEVLGPPIAFDAATGGAGLTGDGTLWVALPAQGRLVPVRHGTAGPAVPVGRPGARLSVTLVDGLPVAVNAADGVLVAVRDGRAAPELRLPVPAGAGRELLVAPSVDGRLVPVLVGGTATLLLADLAAGTVRTVELRSQDPSDRLGVPVVAEGRVYVPDRGTGRLLVYTTGPGRFDPPITVTSGPAELTVFVKNGTVWANDERGSRAVMVRPDGSARPVEKYTPDVAGSASTTPAASSPDPASRSAARRRWYRPSTSFDSTCVYPQVRPRNSHNASTTYTTSRDGSSRRRSSTVSVSRSTRSTSSGGNTFVNAPTDTRSGNQPSGDTPADPSCPTSPHEQSAII